VTAQVKTWRSLRPKPPIASWIHAAADRESLPQPKCEYRSKEMTNVSVDDPTVTHISAHDDARLLSWYEHEKLVAIKAPYKRRDGGTYDDTEVRSKS